ncbi:MAG: AAA family ATPase [Actinobacteria bacterium]|uniref:DNA 3'-5' helicase n=2 Tax=freshwater metagenome TaxID=449393 RepID=A0A6J6A7S0_9ZZZZ|nr:AAA family ATPase [Actinomycetota bacterium]MSW77439.1 AAA family ATPase [Actinomycetota bacterium]MSX54637.1 AAA family ATPase [Actinomycetota bacterium]MSZ82637.1 AAA family ATPase [Actinomycetota bacterium]MTB17851.1 AAA family ATPase [Actinomycetota bacterium]
MTLDPSPRRRAIACVYCGGEHTSADEVRECWQRSGGEAVVEAVGEAVGEAVVDVAEPPRIAADQVVHLRRGPAVLGRNVIVGPGMSTPLEWSGAERVVVDPSDPGLLPRLVVLAMERTGCVFEFSPATVLGEPFATSLPPHAVGPRVRFSSEQLRHLLLSNSVDAREGGTWPLLQQSLAVGARVVADARGDIELPDGSRAWLDGGPPRFTEPQDGVPVLHRIAVEHGRLAAPLGNSAEAELAADQLAAVTHSGGAARIIAPAGSGKTRVLTERARHLVQQWRLPPSAITLIAFNKRAQEEISARTADLPGLQVRTLNAIALAIINGSAPFARQPQRFNTIDEPEVRRLIGRMVKFPRVRNSDPVATWLEALSLARLGLVDPQKVESRYDGEVEGFADVFLRYRTELARANAVDYDEQVFKAIELLLRDPQARATAQRSCRLLLVDEFQDLTPAHLLLVRLLAGPDAAVFGVGDDDQTIYGYNGADPSWLIEFADLFPGAGDHPLEVNYRCPAGVVRAADTLLRHNRRRVPKTIRAHHTELDGFMVAPSVGNSVDTTVDAVSSAVAAGTQPNEIAVLTRVNSLLVPVQVALRGAGIPTNGGVGLEFLERTAVRAALAWIRLAGSHGTFSPADVAEALRRPSRSMPPKVAEWVGEQSTLKGLHKLAERVTNDKVSEFANDIERLQRMVASRGTTSQLLAALRDSMGLATSIAKLDVHRKGMNRAAQNDDLTALAQLAALQPDPAAFESWLRGALSTKWSDGGVTLATVHRVKGQEWPFVVVHHADADQFPHRLAENDEEERRLFHVAITRASRDALVVPSEHPSPFILECSTEPVAIIRSSPPPATPRPPSSVMTKPGDGLTADDAALFEALRAWRKHASGSKPAYTVLADAALHDIARTRPSSLDELARVKGVGPAKLQLYGAGILAVVASA